jgi:mannosyltransferase
VSQTDYHLVIVGKDLTPEEKKSINSKIPESRYHLMGYVPNSELNILYNHAAALVYPSAYEGFGIPVLEAQKAGCPVIACNNSSIPEVIGQTPLLMPKLSDEELIAKLRLLGNRDLMLQVRAEGLSNARRFSWQKMADGYTELYQSF